MPTVPVRDSKVMTCQSASLTAVSRKSASSAAASAGLRAASNASSGASSIVQEAASTNRRDSAPPGKRWYTSSNSFLRVFLGSQAWSFAALSSAPP